MSVPRQFQANQFSPLPIFIAIAALLIGVFFTFDLYTSSMEKSEELQNAQKKSQDAGTSLTALNSLKAQATVMNSEVQKYIGEFREDKILESIFGLTGSGTQIEGISIDSGEKLTSGMSLVGINLTLQTETSDQLLQFLDRATDQNAPRRFLVKLVSFSYDSSTSNLPLTAIVQLGMYSIK